MASILKMLDCLSLVNKNHCQSSLCRTLADGHHARWSSGYQRPGTSVEKISPWKTIDNFKKVVEDLKTQCGFVKKEVADFMKEFDQKPMENYVLNQTKVIWEFRSEEDLNKWVLGSDTAIGGKSEICLKLDKNKQYGILSGNLNTTVPHDGVTRYSGYCAMVSKPEMVSTIILTFLKVVYSFSQKWLPFEKLQNSLLKTTILILILFFKVGNNSRAAFLNILDCNSPLLTLTPVGVAFNSIAIKR